MNSKDRAPAAPPAEQADSLPDAQSMRLFNELVATRSQPDEINEQCLLKLWNMARPERFELPTLCFEGRCSIQLSYGRVPVILPVFGDPSLRQVHLRFTSADPAQ